MSADLSYEINKGGGGLSCCGEEEERKVGHTLNIQHSLHYRSATLGFFLYAINSHNIKSSGQILWKSTLTHQKISNSWDMDTTIGCLQWHWSIRTLGSFQLHCRASVDRTSSDSPGRGHRECYCHDGCVLSLQQCLIEWYVSKQYQHWCKEPICPGDHCTVIRWSMLQSVV